MKKIILIATALLMGFFADAANLFFWDWPAMPAISSSTTNVFCLPASANVRVGFYYDYNVVVGTSREYRAKVELRNPSTGATFNSPWAPVTSAAAGSYAATYTSPTQTTSVNVSASGRFSATVWVQYRERIGGKWSGWYSFKNFNSTERGPEFQFNSSNSAVTFTVNGKKQTSNGTPPEIVLCNGAELKIDNITGLGTHTTIETSMESGWYEPLAPVELRFTPYSGYISPYLVCYPGTISLTGLLSPYRSYFYVVPAGGVRYVKVKVKVYGPCDPPPGFKEVEMVFKVIDAAAFVDFEMFANSCGGMTGVARQTTLPISDASFTASPCIPGWQGAGSAGIVSFNTVGSTSPIISYNVKIEEVHPITGAYIWTVSDQTTYTSLPLNYLFMLPTSGYFNDPLNYPSLSTTKRTFKATLTVNTDNCSNSNFSYFRIANGSRFYKTTDGVNAITEAKTEEPTLYPNPSNDKVTISYSNLNAASSIVIFDNLGKKVLSQENLGSNGASISIQNLSNGIYFYTLKSGAETFHGKLIKN